MMLILLDLLFRLLEVAQKGLEVGVVLLLLTRGVPDFISMPLAKAISSISNIFPVVAIRDQPLERVTDLCRATQVLGLSLRGQVQ